MSDIVLIRPGCTDFDEQNRIQGSLDLPPSSRGQEQIARLVNRLRDVPFDVIYSAPCEPARSTALAVSQECGVPYKSRADLKNLNYGLWQGLQIDDVRRKYPKVFKQWQDSPETVCLPEGETVAEAVERIERMLRKCLKRRRTVGLVASEPLATLIGCVLRHARLELPDATAVHEPESRVEFFHLSDEDRKWSQECELLGVHGLEGADPPAESRNGHGSKSGGSPSPKAASSRVDRVVEQAGAPAVGPTNGKSPEVVKARSQTAGAEAPAVRGRFVK